MTPFSPPEFFLPPLNIPFGQEKENRFESTIRGAVSAHKPPQRSSNLGAVCAHHSFSVTWWLPCQQHGTSLLSLCSSVFPGVGTIRVPSSMTGCNLATSLAAFMCVFVCVSPTPPPTPPTSKDLNNDDSSHTEHTSGANTVENKNNK